MKNKINRDNRRITIRKEVADDYEIVEKMTREAFWNLYVPGCSEHYLVHTMRSHEDFLAELAFVIELDGKIVGNVMYTKARLIDDSGNTKDILTFGPVCILPEYQRQGLGKLLLNYSFEQAGKLGYDVIVIFGSPSNYVNLGFKSCKKYNISFQDNLFPTAMMINELNPDVLDGRKWVYHESPVMQIDSEKAQIFDKGLEKMMKEWQPSQEEFYILSHSSLQ